MNKLGLVGLFLVLLGIFLFAFGYLGVCVPADTTFNREFQAHETMAHDSASFEKMRDQIMIIWTNMNNTWNPDKFDTMYNTWWGPGQNYENSLAATNDYLTGLVSRIDATMIEIEQIRIGNKTILTPYNAYYQQQLDSFRNETQEAGGLLWAIHGVWYLQFASGAYWFFWWGILPAIILLVAGILLLIASSDF